MANKLKKKAADHPKSKPKKSGTAPGGLLTDKVEKIDLKKLAGDERTWKIIGAVSLFISLFLFIAFISYFFTWKEDQKYVLQGNVFDNGGQIKNLLGGIGAFISNLFIRNGFGVASLLICTFFFVSGVNLMVNRRVFSIWRNLKYVTIGMLVLSVSFAYLSSLFFPNDFPYGGGVGVMITHWLVQMIGNIGTAVLLIVIAIAYIIWQFNPSFHWPEKKEEMMDEQTGSTLKDDSVLPGEELIGEPKPESLKPTGSMVLTIHNNDEKKHDLQMIEKDEQVTEPIDKGPSFENEIVSEILHQHDLKETRDSSSGNKITTKNEDGSGKELELEIKQLASDNPEYENLPPYEPTLDLRDYKYPTLNLLETHGSEKIIQDANELENNKNQIISTLRNYDIEIQKISATVGPTVTLYEIVPAAGVRISRIRNLEDDIALSLSALGIRIIAPIPGKGTIGIEVPNAKKTLVSMKTLLSSEKFQHNTYSLPIALGKRIDNENYIVDLTSMPHLLMAGATGQGKSVGVNAILVSLLYKKHPSQLKFVLIDPKKVELNIYRHIEKYFLAKLPGEEEAIITDTKKVIHTLNALCIEMDNRYDLLKEAGARNIKEYNEKFIKRRLNPQRGHQYLPFIILVIDEFADLIMSAGKEIEMPIARLAQLARAVGIHLIIATQRPSVNIITGTIKANFPCRIAFKVTSKIDSRTILDTGGADQLIGKGDMLISFHGEITRLQCVFVDTPEVERIVDFIAGQKGYPQPFLLPEYVDEKELEGREFDSSDRDPLFGDAARLIVQNQVGSTSLLQRRMKLGYNRAGRLMDQLEAAGVVGPSQGSKARDVLIKTESELQIHLNDLI